MVLLLRMLYDSYQKYADEHIEPLIDNYFLMGSPLKILSITVLYWLFVMKWGQKFMEKRQPYDLKKIMLAFNFFQIIFNFYVVFMAFKILLGSSFYSDWSCMRTTRPTPTTAEIHGFYCYFIMKVTDYLDTIFMVLRKRNRQISFLHVYHHIIMVFCTYIAARYYTGGHTVILGLANGSVHIVMYTYYFIAALRPGIQHAAWWKKYITQMQLVQFVYLIVHFSRALFNRNCEQSPILMFFCLLQAVLMLGLFADFYYKAYIRKPTKPKSEEIKS